MHRITAYALKMQTEDGIRGLKSWRANYKWQIAGFHAQERDKESTYPTYMNCITHIQNTKDITGNTKQSQLQQEQEASKQALKENCVIIVSLTKDAVSDERCNFNDSKAYSFSIPFEKDNCFSFAHHQTL